jgi:uncharacterized protein (TIGR02246 family)
VTDEEGIRRTLALYCQLCDDGRFDEFADLFTEAAELRVMGQVQAGREAIQMFMAVAQGPEARGKHVTSNTVITVDGHSARAFTDYLFVSKERAITNVGRYHDRLVREADGVWRFAEREIVFLGDDDAPAPDYGA